MSGNTVPYTGAAIARAELPALPPIWPDEVLVLFERIATGKVAGSAVPIPDGVPYGEAIELRYTCAITASDFNGIFLQVDTSVANTSDIKGVDISARRSGVGAVGSLQGGNFAAYTGSGKATGNVNSLIGLQGEAQQDAAYTATNALVVALSAKLSTISTSTITEGYGLLINNEAIVAGKAVTAAIGVKSTSKFAAYTALIDATGCGLVVHDGDQVTLIAFNDAAGTAKTISYDVSAGTIVYA